MVEGGEGSGPSGGQQGVVVSGVAREQALRRALDALLCGGARCCTGPRGRNGVGRARSPRPRAGQRGGAQMTGRPLVAYCSNTYGKKFSATVSYFARRTTPLNLPPRVVLRTHSRHILLAGGEPSCEQSSRLILPLFHDLFLPWLNDSDPKIQRYMIEVCSQRRD
jgi:hypothetical protein